MRLPRDEADLNKIGKCMHQALVFLNGTAVTAVVEVDDEEGWVKRIVKHDQDGTEHETLEGNVSIVYHQDTIEKMVIKAIKKQCITTGRMVYVAFTDVPSFSKRELTALSKECGTRREAVNQVFDILEEHGYCETCGGEKEVLFMYPRGIGDAPGNQMIPCPQCQEAKEDEDEDDGWEE